eukprot:Em0001g540a
MEFTDTACKVFRECALVPSIAGATVLCTDPERSRYEVRVNWEQRDLERGKQVVTTKSYFVERKGDHVVSVCGTTFQADSSSVLRQTFSGDGGVRAVLLKDKSSKAEPGSEPQQYIEVWRSGNLVKVIEVPSLKKHGIIHENETEGSHEHSSVAKGTHLAGEEAGHEGVGEGFDSDEDDPLAMAVDQRDKNIDLCVHVNLGIFVNTDCGETFCGMSQSAKM